MSVALTVRQQAVDRYVNTRMRLKDIARELGVGEASVKRWAAEARQASCDVRRLYGRALRTESRWTKAMDRREGQLKLMLAEETIVRSLKQDLRSLIEDDRHDAEVTNEDMLNNVLQLIKHHSELAGKGNEEGVN
jgi:predicted transcriptional regulator